MAPKVSKNTIVDEAKVSAKAVKSTKKSDTTVPAAPVVEKKTKKTQAIKYDEMLQEIANSDKNWTEEEIKSSFGKKVNKNSKFSTKTTRPESNYNRFMKEYKMKRPDTKVSLAEMREAWKVEKANPKSKYFQDPLQKKEAAKKYEGLKPGQAIPGKEGYILGNNGKPVKKDGVSGKKVLAGIKTSETEDDEDEEEASEEEEDEEEEDDE